MSYRAIDLETTGLPKDNGEPTGIMQVGWCDMRFNIIKPPHGFFVDSGVPVEIEARAIHHISDEMVAGEIKPDEATTLLARGEHEYTVAHNIEHEKHYISPGVVALTGEPRQWICTYKTALRIWPEAPGHKLQELRYFLKLDDEEDFDPKLAEPPHRAPGDAYVCAHLLRRVLKEITVEQAVRWSSGPALLWMCFMKKYKGTPWKDVPKDYLDWILNKSDITDRDIRATAKYYFTRSAKPHTGDNPYP
jgi:exodeoxyribonuclease X